MQTIYIHWFIDLTRIKDKYLELAVCRMSQYAYKLYLNVYIKRILFDYYVYWLSHFKFNLISLAYFCWSKSHKGQYLRIWKLL